VRQRIQLTGTNRPRAWKLARARYGTLRGDPLSVTPGSDVDPSVEDVVEPGERTVSGGHGGGETPVPIPNTAVKPASADGTWGVAPWESRTPPGFLHDYAPACGGIVVSRPWCDWMVHSSWSRSGLKIGLRTWQQANPLVRRAREDPEEPTSDPPEGPRAKEAPVVEAPAEEARAEGTVDVGEEPRGRGGRMRPVGPDVPPDARGAPNPVDRDGPVVPAVAAAAPAEARDLDGPMPGGRPRRTAAGSLRHGLAAPTMWAGEMVPVRPAGARSRAIRLARPTEVREANQGAGLAVRAPDRGAHRWTGRPARTGPTADRGLGPNGRADSARR
jgi:hypothetical protein